MFQALMKTMKAKKMLPQISDTERMALEAGTVWVDGEFFNGSPDFRRMMNEPYSALSAEEQAFIDGPVTELCKMVDAYNIGKTRQIPPEIMQFMKDKGFFGMLIPKKYGGLELSTSAISTIMAMTTNLSAVVSTFIVIPNSLGAAELIKHYGTQEQKDHYLPKLARGEYIPCFGLTEPTAGSDAASIKAEGEVFKDADGGVKIRLNFAKRYITLAPVANLISLACQIRDPQNLLGKGEAPGITVALLHKGMPGLSNGDHHQPIGDAFYNGPIYGKDVVVPVENIIGGPEYAGQGWRMLMEQLAGGRAVSLPAGAIGGMKAVAATTGAYSMVRQQFGIPIGRMEGVEDKVARIAALTYMCEASRVYACSAIDAGEQPPVVSAVLKAYTTEIARQCAIDGMDVFSGAGVMQGPNNILGTGYTTAPVGVTVEGANIMTRTLIIFGQGATRCHPYAQNVVNAAEQDDADAFRKNLLAWFGQFALTVGRTFVRSLTRGWSAGSPVSGPTAKHFRKLGWAAARYAMLTNLAMFFIGGKLKARGKLTGRYADALAWQYFALSALRRYEAEGRKAEDLPVVNYAVSIALSEVQKAFEGIYSNFDAPVLGLYMRTVGAMLVRLNTLSRGPSDQETTKVAMAIQAPGAQYDRIIKYTYAPADGSPGVGRLLAAWRLGYEAQPVISKIVSAQKAKKLERGTPDAMGDAAKAAGVINADEADLVNRAYAARIEAIQVDVFSPEEFFGVKGLTAAPGFEDNETATPRLAASA
ncbi:acyl-CoA dehydrogenase [Algiphilus sp.]|uniref:acyl-CoA dehydrogenase n=1 Tax=Algiphilus sp. TaxID=1872431 RepID=UPI001CA67CC9|nr:acyl-CoA dehydrogenase [Algiphilus sp.]MBY8966196.1 acyl-CoA dehydrogenase [Algiphilus acroporae]MCI5104666.1 acyl-CoA dehydrogenase [Algiphilus sp.]MCR9090089.1 acyl-CoA dehydrogenase [Pseudomonadota bacterium]